MNIISNCCAGAYIYRDYLKVQYPNPFIWSSIITLNDLYGLIQKYNSIDFENVSLIKFADHIPLYPYWTDFQNQYRYLTGLSVDNTFNVFWTHNYYDPNCNVPKVLGGEVYYCKNYEYTLENWNKRIKRMDMADKPIFLLLTQRSHYLNFEETSKLLKDFPDENMIIITAFRELLKYNTNNHRIYYTPWVDRSPEPILKELYNSMDFNF